MLGNASSGENRLAKWIDHVFDHPVAAKGWYFGEDAPEWEGRAEETARFIAECFEESGKLLARFDDGQLDQGFWYLVSASGSDFMEALVDVEVDLGLRIRALRSFVPVFEQVIAARCSPHLSHLDEQVANALNSACYMWWDIAPLRPAPGESQRVKFDREALGVMERILAIRHDACRESALHGLGHWSVYPEAQRIIDDFLAREKGLRPEVVAYAVAARKGMVL